MSPNVPPGLDLNRFRPKPAASSRDAASVSETTPPGNGTTLGLVGKERRVREILAGLENLPSLPDVVARILQMTNDPSTGVGEFEEIVRKDQALAAKVLRLVNSPFFGVKNEVTTIPQAIVVLGLKTLKSVVLAARTSDLFNRELGAYLFEPGGMWKRSLACADVCQGVAGRLDLGRETSERLFIAGLLHDIGKVLLAPHVVRERDLFRMTLENSGGDAVAAEIEVFGISHADLGGRMAEKWNLPERLRGLIVRHHEPVPAPEGTDEELAVVQLADVLCDGLRVGRIPEFRANTDRFPTLLETLGLLEDRAAVEAEAKRAVDAMQAVFDTVGHPAPA